MTAFKNCISHDENSCTKDEITKMDLANNDKDPFSREENIKGTLLKIITLESSNSNSI